VTSVLLEARHGSKDRMYLGIVLGVVALAAWLLYSTRPAEEPTQQGPVSAPSTPTSGVSGSR
jgi:hypothetical protein